MTRSLLLSLILLSAFAYAQVSTLGNGGIGTSCNAVTAASSINPGLPGGCTSLNLVTLGGTLPGIYTWQVISTGFPATLGVNLLGSLDGVTWTQLDTTAAAATRTVSSFAYRFLGCVVATLTGGTAPTVTCQISVSGASGAVNSPNNGSAGAVASYATAGGSTTIGPDPGMQSSLVGVLQLGAVGVGNGTLVWRGTTSGSGSMGCTNNTCTSVTMAAPQIISSPSGLTSPRYVSGGTTFTTNAGCGEGAGVGGATAGKITTVGLTTCTDIITFATAAPNGYQCMFTDLTTAGSAANPHQTGTTTTTVTWVSGTIVAADVIQFACIGY